ncbi:MAG: hypothetical protein R2806_23665 [Saprospiraceae bacterium]
MGFSHQAVARQSDTPIRNSELSLRISIIKGSPSGGLAYRETHQVELQRSGSVYASDRPGVAEDGDFSAIDWAEGPFISCGYPILMAAPAT